MDVNKLTRLFVAYSLFNIGGLVYVCIELLYRGHTHYTMFILGGICFNLVGYMNEVCPFEMCLLSQSIIGSLIITFCEFVTGCIVNLALHWNVWDYSSMPYNLLGQVCLLFSIFWVGLACACVVVNDYLLYKCGIKEEMPKYKIL